MSVTATNMVGERTGFKAQMMGGPITPFIKSKRVPKQGFQSPERTPKNITVFRSTKKMSFLHQTSDFEEPGFIKLIEKP